MLFLELIAGRADRSKCQQLYETYRGQMYAIAYGILNDSKAAEDAVQQAFIKTIDYLQKIGEIDCPKTQHLMVIIIRSVALTMYNRRKKHPESPIDLFYDMAAEDGGSEDAVTAAILRLPAIYAETLELRYVQGFSAKETAKLLGITDAAVQKRLTRGKELLRELLEKEGFHVPG